MSEGDAEHLGHISDCATMIVLRIKFGIFTGSEIYGGAAVLFIHLSEHILRSVEYRSVESAVEIIICLVG